MGAAGHAGRAATAARLPLGRGARGASARGGGGGGNADGNADGIGDLAGAPIGARIEETARATRAARPTPTMHTLAPSRPSLLDRLRAALAV